MKYLFAASVLLMQIIPVSSVVAQTHLIESSPFIVDAKIALARVNRNDQTKILKAAAFDGWAIVKWNNGENGGLATLKKNGNHYQMITDSSRGWLGITRFCKESGMPLQVAKKLLSVVMPDWEKWENGSK